MTISIDQPLFKLRVLGATLCILCGTKQPEHKEYKEKYSTKFTK